MTNVTGIGVAVAIWVTACGSALADTAPAAGSVPAAARAPTPASSSVPPDFRVPTLVQAPGFKLVPLGPAVVTLDFEAYMSSVDHLQKTFSRSTKWPHPGISQADAMRDMEGEQGRFQSRKSFAYAVLTPDGKRERGSVYISAGVVDGYDATVRMWVTQRDYDAGFDAELYRWVSHWIQAEWPFAKVAYPGRAIDWNTWDAMVAAKKASSASRQSAPAP